MRLLYVACLTQYIWSARIPEAQVSLMGAVTLPAKYLPYANLLIDLIVGGPGLMLEAATGLASAFVWNYIRHARLRPGNSLGGRTKLDAVLIKYLQPWLVTPPRVRRLLMGNVRMHSRTYGTAYTASAPEPNPSSWWPSSWWPLGARGRTTGTASGTARAKSNSVPDRDAIRAATEARLRSNRGE